ncbi:MAG: DciA family protein [Gammaproteobacteria bacterium]|nr:DciA family protein [Gammaproteobacteria bacterium]
MRAKTTLARRRIDGLLRDGGRGYRSGAQPLHRLLRKGQQMQSLTEQVRALLPPQLAPHCTVADLAGDRLTLHADNASFATRLQFETPKLRVRLQKLSDFAEITDIRVHTGTQRLPEPRRLPQVALRRRPPSGLLRRLAEGISDEGLRASIERLDRDARGD